MTDKNVALPPGEAVRALRLALGIPRHRLAAAARLGVSTIERYEAGETTRLTHHNAIALQRAIRAMRKALAADAEPADSEVTA